MTAKRPGVNKKRKKAKRLSPDDLKRRKLKNDHMRSVRSVFRNLGFERVSEVAGVDIEVGGQRGEFDDCFLFENLLLLVEYTTTQGSEVTGHLKHKKIIFSNVLSNTEDFLSYIREKIPEFDNRLGTKFHPHQYIMKIVYCSRFAFDVSVKEVVTEPVYLDYPVLKYFEKLASIIKMSALSEVLHFLGIAPKDVAKRGVFSKYGSVPYDGSILPESSSGFPKGYKVVSFYVDAAALLSRAYVLRRDGWRSSYQAYQRMISGPKIEAIRKKLRVNRQVFMNNLIVTLPEDVHPVGPDGKTIDMATLKKTAPVKINLPQKANSIGLIDGQHRLYSYYEAKEDDPQIAQLRDHQNLLVTGIVYPPGTKRAEQERFEASLFLAINSNQTNAPTPLRQEIEVFLTPYSPMAIGRQVMRRLAETGPLSGHVEEYFFDKGKLKTSSIVSFGLGPLLKLSGTDSLFSVFSHPDKNLIEDGESDDALAAYVQFATNKINTFLGAARANLESERWTTDSSVKNRLLAVTYVNSFLIIMRHLIENKHSLEFDYLKARLNGINSFDFKAYHSSQYARMAEKMYQQYFEKTKTSSITQGARA